MDNTNTEELRYQLRQINRRYYVVDTHKNDEKVGVTRTSLTRPVQGVNKTQAIMLMELCNHIESLEA